MNTACFTLVPVSIMAIRVQQGAKDPTDVFVPILITTYCATLIGIMLVAIRQRILSLQLVAWLASISTTVGVIIYGFTALTPETKQKVSSIAGNLILFGIIIAFIAAGALKKIKVFDAFIEGAKEGFNTVLRILPYLLAMLVAIGVFRASGAMTYLTDGIKWCFIHAGMNADFVDSLPVAFMKPLSGGGTQGLTVDAIKTFGVDSFTGRLSSIMYASADTTFYIVALYFGSVGIKNTRYAIQAGLLADLAGIVAAIFMAYLFFH
jgi:spore maturation protein SpmB